MSLLIVTAAVIRYKNKICIAQRMINSEHPLKWEFPGGKLEEGEDPETCLIREIKEELNLDIQVKDIFKVVYHEYTDKRILLLCYSCDLKGGETLALECNDYRWVSTGELKNFNFVEADIDIVEKIYKMENRIFEFDV